MSNPANTGLASSEVEKLLTYRESAKILAISVPTFWRRVADGTIPKPIKIGSASRWPLSEVLAVVDAAKKSRGAE